MITAVLAALLLQAPILETDTQQVQRLVSAGGFVQLEARTYHLTAPIAMPPRPVRVEGVREATQLIWSGGHGFVGVAPGYYVTMPWTVQHVSFGCAGRCGTAVDFRWPDAGSVNEPTTILQHLTIRPHPSTSTAPGWTRGIDLTNGWGASIREVAIHSNNADPTSLEAAITLRRWSTGVRVSDFILYGGQVGVQIDATEIGHGEGPLLSRMEMVNVGIGVNARSALAGGRPTPWIVVSDSNIAARQTGIMFEGRTQGAVSNNLIYGVPPPGITFIGLYLAGQSHHARVTGNQVYVLVPGGVSYGILIDHSHGGTVVGNVITDATLGIWLTPSTRGWSVGLNSASGAAWGAVVNQGHP